MTARHCAGLVHRGVLAQPRGEMSQRDSLLDTRAGGRVTAAGVFAPRLAIVHGCASRESSTAATIASKIGSRSAATAIKASLL